MSKIDEGYKIEVDWIDGDDWSPTCMDCYYFRHTYCDNGESDHNCHLLHPTHPACKEFEEK